jgi:hypothetical protein
VARFDVAKTRTKNEVYAIRMVIEELNSRPRDLPTHSLNRPEWNIAETRIPHSQHHGFSETTN